MEKFLDKHFEVGFRGYRNQIDDILTDLYPGKNEEFVKVRQWIISRLNWGVYIENKAKCLLAYPLVLRTYKSDMVGGNIL